VVKYPEVIPEVNRACFHHCLYIVSAYKETWAFMVVIVWEFDLHLPSSVMCVYHRLNCEFAWRSWCGVVDTTLSDNVWQCLTTGRFPPPRTLTRTIWLNYCWKWR